MTTVNNSIRTTTQQPSVRNAPGNTNAPTLSNEAASQVQTLRRNDQTAYADDVIRELRDPNSVRGFEMLKSDEFKTLPPDEQDRIVRTALAATGGYDLNNMDDRVRAAALFSSLMAQMSDIDSGGLKITPETMGNLIVFAEQLSTAIPDGTAMGGVLQHAVNHPNRYFQRLAQHLSMNSSASPAEQLASIRHAIKTQHGADAAQSDVEDASQRPPLNDGMKLPTGAGLEAMLISFLGQIENEHKGQLDGLLAGGELSQTVLAQSKMALDKLSAQMDMALGVLSDIGDLEKKKGRIFQA